MLEHWQEHAVCILNHQILPLSRFLLTGRERILEVRPMKFAFGFGLFLLVFHMRVLLYELWWVLPASNRRPPRYEQGALPIALRTHMVEVTGFEPAASCSQSTPSTTELHLDLYKMRVRIFTSHGWSFRLFFHDYPLPSCYIELANIRG